MTFPEVNLARRPFANSRPVVRITIGLWVIGAVLVLANVFLYGRSLAGMEEMEQRIEVTREAIVEERERIVEAEERLRGMDLREQNEVAGYLNDRIDERTFPWSRLFDHLADVLPREVRLHNLRPRRFEPKTREAATRRDGSEVEPAEAEELVGLSMTGQARSDEALLGLLDNLFASGWFEDPQLASETRDTDGTLGFQLSATYLPATIRARRAPDVSFAAVEEIGRDAATLEAAEEMGREAATLGAVEETGREAATLGAAEETGREAATLGAAGDEPAGAARGAGPSTPGARASEASPRRDRSSPAPGATPRARTEGMAPPSEATGASRSRRGATVGPIPIKPSASRPGGSP